MSRGYRREVTGSAVASLSDNRPKPRVCLSPTSRAHRTSRALGAACLASHGGRKLPNPVAAVLLGRACPNEAARLAGVSACGVLVGGGAKTNTSRGAAISQSHRREAKRPPDEQKGPIMQENLQTSRTPVAVRSYDILDNHPPAPTTCRHCGSPIASTLTPGGEQCYECSNRGCQWTGMASLFAERRTIQE
jgi:hypothetical protein